MEQFIPEVSAVVTLIVRYKNGYILSDNKYDDTTYENVTVLEPEAWMKSDQVKITSDTDRMPFRVIAIRNIYSVNGKRVAAPRVAVIKRVQVTGSKGNQYTIMLEDGTATSCTCPGYAYRKKCRHLAEVEAA